MAERTPPQTKINREVLQQAAKNARLQLTEEEIQNFQPQLTEILTFFSAIQEIKTEAEPSFLPIKTKTKDREDTITESLTQEEALKNAQTKNGYIKAPKTI